MKALAKEKNVRDLGEFRPAHCFVGCAYRLRMKACGLVFLSLPAISLATPSEVRQHELVRLVRQDCGSCHGMRLSGGLGQPLTAIALRDKPANSLVATILRGRAGTAMPAWYPVLSDADAEWIVERLITGFPEEAR